MHVLEAIRQHSELACTCHRHAGAGQDYCIRPPDIRSYLTQAMITRSYSYHSLIDYTARPEAVSMAPREVS